MQATPASDDLSQFEPPMTTNLPAQSRHALVASDGAPIRDFLRLHLDLAGFAVDEVKDGPSALDRANNTPFDLIILDFLLSRIDGITVCRTLRAGRVNREAPILMVSDRTNESDKVLGLESGADDFITSPFATREFLARVGAVTRRVRRTSVERPRSVGAHGVVLDVDRRRVVVRGAPIVTTRQEFDVLYLLAARPGIVFSREALLAHVSGGATHVTVRTIDTVVSRIRRKIELDPRHPQALLTAWGVGYKFADLE